MDRDADANRCADWNTNYEWWKMNNGKRNAK
jgi:hypothetical protein